MLIAMLIFVKHDEDKMVIDCCLVCYSKNNDDIGVVLQNSNM